ncbi:hypothetical protein K474DRAFT_1768908 [Panus rudis PR-1116 ss-1]|nr:hypothetical protein K474DRAFT_1768908 [Panus rudis PR-1116 ss-1]
MGPSVESWSQSPAPPEKHPGLAQDPKEKPKKPRHRHSAFQLAALNELYDKNDHPPLEDRTSLAERLGMEVKTVNAWFQNKRASCKKRSNKVSQSAAPSYELPPISALIASVAPSSAPPPPPEFDDYSEDEQYPPYSDRDLSRIPHGSQHHRQRQSSFFAGNPQHRHLLEADQASVPRKGRSRPSPAQTEELRKLYDRNSHPSKEEREELGRRIGMRYQSVTNWFQNQRSIAKKRKEDEDARAAAERDHSSSSSRTYSPFPPSSSTIHPSLSANVPPATSHPSLPSSASMAPAPRARRASSTTPTYPLYDSRPSSPRASPYHMLGSSERGSSVSNSRSRRTRPEPYQLDALKKLFNRTPTPSIEERGALALEIGMDVGKVTNWFRNLRQTTRRRIRRNPDDFDDFDDDDVSLATHTAFSRDASRAGSPFASTSGSSLSPMHPEDNDVVMAEPIDTRYPHPDALQVKLEDEDKRHKIYSHAPLSRSHSDMGSDEEYQEAVTPPSEHSLLPTTYASSATHAPKRTVVHATESPRQIALTVDALTYAQMEKATAKYQNGVRVEDALLLLSFHHNVVR